VWGADHRMRSWLRPTKDVGKSWRRDIAWNAIETNPLSDPHHCRGKLSVLGDVNLPAPRQPAFHLFRHDAASSEAANELKPCFGQLIKPTLVGDDRRTDVAIASGN
jgi:hypothetical protein